MFILEKHIRKWKIYKLNIYKLNILNDIELTIFEIKLYEVFEYLSIITVDLNFEGVCWWVWSKNSIVL